MSLVKLLSDKFRGTSLIIALIPLLGYLLATMYEYGYLSHFGVDYNVVSINPQVIIISLFTSVFIISMLVQLYDAYAELLQNKRQNSDNKAQYSLVLYRYFGIAIISVIMLMLTKDSVFAALYLMLLAIIGGLIITNYLFLNIYSLFSTKRFRGIWEKSATNYWESRKDDSKAGSEIYSVIIIGLLVLAILASIGFVAGRFIADSNDSSYRFLTQDSTKLVIIRQYGDLLVLKELDESSNELLKGYALKTVGDEQVDIKYQKTDKELRIQKIQ